MQLKQNDFEHILDMVAQGNMGIDQANVEKVRMQRVLLVTKLPAEIRKTLNAAVKGGDLGHMKRDGHKPEAYYHPTFDYLARSERNKEEDRILRSAKRFFEL